MISSARGIVLPSEKILKISEILEGYFQDKPVKKAYLFGSVARQEDTSESDIDLLLELEYIAGISKVFIRMNQELKNLLQKKVDIVTTESLSGFGKKIIDNEKILIYEK